MNCMLHFVHDHGGYLDGHSGHPDGFVINTYSSPSHAYLKLHQATCSTISRLQPGAKTFTGGRYSKVCGDRDELEGYAHYRVDQRRPARFASDPARFPRGISGCGCLRLGITGQGEPERLEPGYDCDLGC